ncbi:MAG: transporter, partial [Bacteroidales bacterium]|nr:transporter [Bacteroidales bacterium]
MNFLPQDLLQPTVIQTIFVISLVSVLGIYLGRIKIKGISLGITFVFFVGIVASYFGVSLNPDMLGYAQSFGLILFVYTLGLEVGPGFFSSFKKGGVTLNMLSICLIFATTLLALGIWALTPMTLSEMMGLLCGAVTNTPMLGAAQQTLTEVNPDAGKAAAEMAMSCAVAYPMGVIGMIIAVLVLRRVFKHYHKPIENKEDKDNTFNGEYIVSNPAVFERTIGEVMKLLDVTVVISRIWHEGVVRIPSSGIHLHQGDHLMVVSDRQDTDRITALFGQMVPKDWNDSEIDWNAIDREVVCKDIYVTEDKLNGVRLGSLKLRNAYGINITRVNRAGIMLVASRDLILQLGDKLTVVGDAEAIDNVALLLG